MSPAPTYTVNCSILLTDLPIDRWAEDLRTGGYDGWISLEYRSGASDPFAWLPPAER